MSEFLSMGGYAPYVWSAYGVTLIVLVYNVWAAYRHHTKLLAGLHRSEAVDETGGRPTVRKIR